jgi:transposase
MESTGVYWKPVYYLLEDAFTCVLVNAAHIKQVPGRKTDVLDCAWIAQLLEHGLLRGSFVPPPPLRDLRDFTRYRQTLLEDRTRQVNRLHKVLQEAGIKLASVASDVLGVSGRAMLQALVAGTTDPTALADLARGRLRAKRPALQEALRRARLPLRVRPERRLPALSSLPGQNPLQLARWPAVGNTVMSTPISAKTRSSVR